MVNRLARIGFGADTSDRSESGERAASTTDVPAAGNRIAAAAPMPRLAPVTSAMAPSSGPDISG